MSSSCIQKKALRFFNISSDRKKEIGIIDVTDMSSEIHLLFSGESGICHRIP